MNKCMAAVDMGTNSFHLIIVQVKSDGSFKIIDREREVIRLGSHKGKEFTWISEGEMEKAIDVEDKRMLCVDIGGGSTEFLLGEKGISEFAESIKIGAVRLSKMFFPDFHLTESGIDMCRQYIKDKLDTNTNLHPNHNFEMAIGSSGTIVAAASIISFRRSGKFKK